MPMPSIIVEFVKAAAKTASKAGARSVATAVKDSGATAGYYLLKSMDDVPAGLSEDSMDHIGRIFEGYINRPSEVHLAVMAAGAEDYSAAFALLGTHSWDWFVPGPEADGAVTAEAQTWAKGLRENSSMPAKCVLADTTGNSPYVVNFVASGIKVGENTYTAAKYAGRIAGLLAGTPLDMSATYAPLDEVDDVTRMSESDLDTAVDAGKFVLFFDGVKVKTGRAVTSLTTVTEDAPEDLKKIKIVEIIDLIDVELRRLCEDEYIGKIPNTYDNKLILCTAVKQYLMTLEDYGILKSGASTAEIDLEAQKEYLKQEGIDVSKMTDKEILEADTGTYVFIRASVGILDAIEDIRIKVNY